MDKLHTLHPGKILLKNFLELKGISQRQAARDMQVDPRRINEIIAGQRSITADTALRLSKYFKNPEQFWMELQDTYDLEKAKQNQKKAEL